MNLDIYFFKDIMCQNSEVYRFNPSCNQVYQGDEFITFVNIIYLKNLVKVTVFIHPSLAAQLFSFCHKICKDSVKHIVLINTDPNNHCHSKNKY